MITVGHLINGQIVTDTERTQDVFNPATGEVTKQVALASKLTVEKAIAAAEAAFPEWRNTPPIKRARVMFRFKELLEQNAERICQMIGEEQPNSLPDDFYRLSGSPKNISTWLWDGGFRSRNF